MKHGSMLPGLLISYACPGTLSLSLSSTSSQLFLWEFEIVCFNHIHPLFLMLYRVYELFNYRFAAWKLYSLWVLYFEMWLKSNYKVCGYYHDVHGVIILLGASCQAVIVSWYVVGMFDDQFLSSWQFHRALWEITIRDEISRSVQVWFHYPLLLRQVKS